MFVIFIGLVILSLLFPKSKKIAFLSLIFIFVTFTFVYYEGDLQVYKWIYYDYGGGLSSSTFEPGFTLLMIIFKFLGLPFTAFRAGLAFLYAVLLYWGIKRYTDYLALALTFSIIFPFGTMVVAMRTAIACVILLNGYHYLYDSQQKKGIIKYLIVVSIASLFHYSSLLFLLFLFSRMKFNNKRIFKIILCTVIFSLILNQTNLIYIVVSHITTRAKTLQWLSPGEGTANFKGAVIIILLLLMNYFLACRCRLNLLSPRKKQKKCRNKQVANFCYKSSIILFFFYPLMILNSPFMRIFYIMVPIFICNVMNVCFSKGKMELCNPPITSQGILLLFMLMILRVYYDFPYMDEHYMLFQEFIRWSSVVF